MIKKEKKIDKNLISLKEAAKISGYSADYIGQLIRSGKIPGKQVYSQITWMTTAEAVKNYKNKGNKDKKAKFGDKVKYKKNLLNIELQILRLFFKTFKSALPILIVVLLSFIFFIIYIFFQFNSHPSIPKDKVIEANNINLIY